MEQFTYSENSINKIIQQAKFKTIIYSIIVFVGVIGSIWYGFDSANSEDKFILPLFFVPFLLIVALISSFFTFTGIRKRLKSFVLTITDKDIIRAQEDTPTIRHLKSDITEIVKFDDGALFIKAKSSKDVIQLAAQIGNVDKLENLLKEIKSIELGPPKVFIERAYTVFSILFIVMIGIFFTSKSIWVVEVIGGLTLAVLIYSFFAYYNNKTIDNVTRRAMYFLLIPILSIISKMYLISSPQYAAHVADNKEKTQMNTLQESGDELLTTINIFTKAPKDQAKDYENGLMSGIKLDNIEADIKTLDNPDSIVLNDNQVMIEIDYPLDSTYFGALKTTNKGFTRKELVKEVSKKYHQIYNEEEATATIKTLPPNKRGKTINRNDTNGKYGIWGHDLADLYLVAIEVYKNKEGKIIIRLTVES